MTQQNMLPSESSEEQQIISKVMLLFLIDKMDIPLSNSQITHFAQEENYLNYLKVQNYLSEMVDIGYLDSTKANNTTRYTITDEGQTALESFIHYIPAGIRTRILKYVAKNRRLVKQDFETVANYFCDFERDEWIVKCVVHEDDMMLMELDLTVVSKEQALTICNNWKNNIDTLYGQIFSILMGKRPREAAILPPHTPDGAPQAATEAAE